MPDPTTLDEVIRELPRLPQRQDATNDQLRDLWRVANQLGMYDAADAIRRMFDPKY